MSTLRVLKESVLADGRIDEAEVATIRAVLYEDGKIAREEAELLFELNDACPAANKHPSWATLFVDGICAHLLEDANSPGVIDDDEAKWLVSKLEADGKLDEIERALLARLSKTVRQLPESIRKLL